MNGMKGMLLIFFGVIILGSFTTPEIDSVAAPNITDLEFGSIKVNGVKYEDDIIIDNRVVSKRKKSASRDQRAKYGHTPITPAENIPWNCDTLVIGIGMSGQLPVTEEFKKEAESRNVVLVLMETPEAVEYFMKHYNYRMNAVFHITC